MLSSGARGIGTCRGGGVFLRRVLVGCGSSVHIHPSLRVEAPPTSHLPRTTTITYPPQRPTTTHTKPKRILGLMEGTQSRSNGLAHPIASRWTPFVEPLAASPRHSPPSRLQPHSHSRALNVVSPPGAADVTLYPQRTAGLLTLAPSTRLYARFSGPKKDPQLGLATGTGMDSAALTSQTSMPTPRCVLSLMEGGAAG
ncbi:hypothetical protein LIA77_03477 [Sarocladium implicatum]|nr:hypothetical protein LIA77_03477 [Sarocladium implicatum]